MNATKMHCSTEQVSAYVMVRCFNKENERWKKKRKTNGKMRLFYSTIAIVCHGFFFHLFVNIFCTINSPILFFIFSIDGYKNGFLFTSLVFLCEFILCVLCLQQSTHLERQLVQPMVSFEMYTCCFFVVDVIC